jgi:hypothetical protein
MNQQPINTLPEDQISPKDVIQKLIGIKDALKNNWKIIVLFVVLGALSGWIFDKVNYKNTRYLGFLTFNLEAGQSGGPASGIADLASAFGLGGGGSESGGLFVGQNFIELVKSRPMIERALLTEVIIKGKKELLANYYVAKSGILNDEWEDNEKFKKIRFVKKPRDQFSLDESMAFMAVYQKINDETLFDKNNPKASFITLKCNTEDEQLSKVWLETLMETVSTFYKETTTRKTRQILHIAARRVDSLARVMAGTDAALAHFNDVNQSLASQQALVTQQRMARNSSLVSSMYYQAVQSLESIRFSLVKETPLITVIDPPVLPLATQKYQFGKSIKGGAVIGLVLAIAFIFIRNTIKEIMNA